MWSLPLQDRAEAGRLLAEKLSSYRDYPEGIILALPRGGVPVAAVIAEELHLPLDVLVVRKLGVPFQPELALGAIASGGSIVLDNSLIKLLGIHNTTIQAIIDRETEELNRREMLFRGDSPALSLAGRTVILVDDGIATGATMTAAIRALRSHKPAVIMVAAPVSSVEAFKACSAEADECVCLATPDPFYGVGYWYRNFEQTSDDQVRDHLAAAARAYRDRPAPKVATGWAESW